MKRCAKAECDKLIEGVGVGPKSCSDWFHDECFPKGRTPCPYCQKFVTGIRKAVFQKGEFIKCYDCERSRYLSPPVLELPGREDSRMSTYFPQQGHSSSNSSSMQVNRIEVVPYEPETGTVNVVVDPQGFNLANRATNLAANSFPALEAPNYLTNDETSGPIQNSETATENLQIEENVAANLQENVIVEQADESSLSLPHVDATHNGNELSSYVPEDKIALGEAVDQYYCENIVQSPTNEEIVEQNTTITDTVPKQNLETSMGDQQIEENVATNLQDSVNAEQVAQPSLTLSLLDATYNYNKISSCVPPDRTMLGEAIDQSISQSPTASGFAGNSNTSANIQQSELKIKPDSKTLFLQLGPFLNKNYEPRSMRQFTCDCGKIYFKTYQKSRCKCRGRVECPNCEKTFANKHNLTRHLNTTCCIAVCPLED